MSKKHNPKAAAPKQAESVPQADAVEQRPAHTAGEIGTCQTCGQPNRDDDGEPINCYCPQVAADPALNWPPAPEPAGILPPAPGSAAEVALGHASTNAEAFEAWAKSGVDCPPAPPVDPLFSPPGVLPRTEHNPYHGASQITPPQVKTTHVEFKDGRKSVMTTLEEAPPEPPQPRAGRVPTKGTIAAAFYKRLEPHGPAFDTLSTNDQADWYARACNVGGAK